MKTTLPDREFAKFRDGKSGDAVAIVNDGGPVPVEAAGVDWDTIETTFPNIDQEFYTYKKSGNTVQTVLVTYESANKKTIIAVSRTRF